jgi:hypothetical protein
MSDRASELLGELARLLRKYGPDEFEHLASMLVDPKFAGTLESVLRSVAKAAPKSKEKETPVHQFQVGGEQEPVVARIRKRLEDKRAYPRVQNLEDEGRRLGVHIPESGFKTRKEAIDSILSLIRGQSAEEAAQILEHLKMPEQRGSLQEWSRIIMGPKRQENQE